jgi:GT2 family glycosyltransferase
VEYFLEQCLNSVKSALKNVSGEVFIVDNNSVDRSVEMVQKKFPEYHLIANRDNRGFSRANNQAIEICKGEYVLLLNPDTIIEEDTLEKVISFMDDTANAGGLGVRMIDGKGVFLPESKRGLPTPEVAFYKIFGLSKIFPKSKRFGKYHLGYLDEFETNEIEILSGAFMLMRHETLNKVGLLDEAFFMYGEDIDLSYRILKGGYKNYYFPETRIIHYKGESTKKSSVNYVFVFYRAMVIFAEKHFSQKNAKLFSIIINLAIYLRAGVAIVARFIKQVTLPIMDFSILTIGLFALTHQWKTEGIEFPSEIINISIPLYALVWFFGIIFSGGYDRPFKLKFFIQGAFFGTLFILVFYGLLPKLWQFSRLFILFGTIWVISYYLVSRLYLHFVFKGKFNLFGIKAKRFAIVGSEEEVNRVYQLLKQTNKEIEKVEFVSVIKKENWSIGTLSQLDDIITVYKLNEIVFCAKDTSASEIIRWMTQINAPNVDFKIAQPDSVYLIGSNSIETAGDFYVLNINAISKLENIRKKRLFDLLASTILIVLSPLLIWSIPNKINYFKHLFYVIIGRKTIIGYQLKNGSKSLLPKIKASILHPTDRLKELDETITDKINLIYARDYNITKDISILLHAWKKLGRNCEY